MKEAKFFIGQIIFHKRFHYRGVVIDVDSEFSGTEEWYEQMAQSHPPKDEPWYHVLVHDSDHETYVAEQNMIAESEPAPITHPLVDTFFSQFNNGHYLHNDISN